MEKRVFEMLMRIAQFLSDNSATIVETIDLEDDQIRVLNSLVDAYNTQTAQTEVKVIAEDPTDMLGILTTETDGWTMLLEVRCEIATGNFTGFTIHGHESGNEINGTQFIEFMTFAKPVTSPGDIPAAQISDEHRTWFVGFYDSAYGLTHFGFTTQWTIVNTRTTYTYVGNLSGELYIYASPQ